MSRRETLVVWGLGVLTLFMAAAAMAVSMDSLWKGSVDLAQAAFEVGWWSAVAGTVAAILWMLWRTRQRAEAALRATEGLFQAVVDHSPAAIYLKDRGGRYLAVNREFEARTGLTRAAVVGRSDFDLFPRSRALAHVASDRPVIEGRRTVESERVVQFADGRERTVLLVKFPVLDAKGEIAGIGVVSTDVSEHRAAERSLRESDARYRRLVESMSDGLVVEDADGLVTYANSSAVRISGYGREELIGRRLTDFLEPENRAIVDRRMTKRPPGDADPCEVEWRRKDGSKIAALMTSQPLEDDQGRLVGSFSVITDITARKRAEEALRAAKEEAERVNRARTRFLAAASHDTRQPLQALGLLMSVLSARARGGTRSTDRETPVLVAKMERAFESLQGLFDTLMDFSRLDAGAVVPTIADVPLATLFARLEAEFGPQAEAKGLVLKVVPCQGEVRSDPVLLDRILRNILANAVRYTDAGKVLMGTRRDDRVLRIEIRDTGRGIAADKLQAIFEEFYKIEDGAGHDGRGLGLGLAIVDRMARLLGHRVTVESWLGKGSSFAVEVPLVRHRAGRR